MKRGKNQVTPDEEDATKTVESIRNHIVGEGNGTPLRYSCLESPMDRGAW